MEKIAVSPYEGNESAEVGEHLFEYTQRLMDPEQGLGSTFRTVEVKPSEEAIEVFGEDKAKAIIESAHQISTSGILYGSGWTEGIIHGQFCGVVEKELLLVCLQDHRLARATSHTMIALIKDLGVWNIFLKALSRWKLKAKYPSLSRCEKISSFRKMQTQCLKCILFVARAAICMKILNWDFLQIGESTSLKTKIRDCLVILENLLREANAARKMSTVTGNHMLTPMSKRIPRKKNKIKKGATRTSNALQVRRTKISRNNVVKSENAGGIRQEGENITPLATFTIPRKRKNGELAQNKVSRTSAPMIALRTQKTNLSRLLGAKIVSMNNIHSNNRKKRQRMVAKDPADSDAVSRCITDHNVVDTNACDGACNNGNVDRKRASSPQIPLKLFGPSTKTNIFHSNNQKKRMAVEDLSHTDAVSRRVKDQNVGDTNACHGVCGNGSVDRKHASSPQISHKLFGSTYKKNKKNTIDTSVVKVTRKLALTAGYFTACYVSDNTSNHSNHMGPNYWYPVDPYEIILSSEQIEAAWLFEESMYCGRRSSIDWVFVMQYASPPLKIVLRQITGSDEREAFAALLDSRVATKRFDVVRKHIRRALLQNVVRERMQTILPRLRKASHPLRLKKIAAAADCISI